GPAEVRLRDRAPRRRRVREDARSLARHLRHCPHPAVPLHPRHRRHPRPLRAVHTGSGAPQEGRRLLRSDHRPRRRSRRHQLGKGPEAAGLQEPDGGLAPPAPPVADMRTIDLQGKAALITGGTRNIGRAIAQALAEAGSDLAIFYRTDDAAAARAREDIRASTGRRAEVYREDVGDEAAVEAGVEKALDDFRGAFNILIHNATRHEYSAATMPEIDTEVWRGALAVNLDAAFFLTRALLRREGALPPGSSVVFISSGRGHGAAPRL